MAPFDATGRHSPGKAPKRNTKNDIFFVAVELFAEKGYRETSMRDIAKKTGIKPASIYNHYASKEQIMEDLLDQYLERMEIFYKKIGETPLDPSTGSTLEELLDQLMFYYEPEERLFMYRMTRVVHHEQFHFPKAADALIGSGYEKYALAHVRYFDRLSEAGYIRGKENNRFYGELFARISLTFATQFLHPDITPTLNDQWALFPFLVQLVVNNERALNDA